MQTGVVSLQRTLQTKGGKSEISPIPHTPFNSRVRDSANPKATAIKKVLLPF
jgi:hypothetical protein